MISGFKSRVIFSPHPFLLAIILSTGTMSLRLLAAPGLRNTTRLLVRQQPMGFVKIHSCKALFLIH
jgi:hypothetical protein